MVQAVIFDMDGLLIDSEPLWQTVENEIFSSLGIPVSDALSSETIGMSTRQTVEFWYQRFPWPKPPLAEVAEQVDQSVLELITKHGMAKPGVPQIVSICQRLALPMAIASSSTGPIIAAVLAKLNLANAFVAIHSAVTEAFGKPHPAVYLATAQELGVSPRRCLVFEDSIAGVLAAKAASMYCVAVPSAQQRHDTRFDIAELTVNSLHDVTETIIREMDKIGSG
jgi:mannitol-1-/sugar-/sorbitol-6-/2-deoxyglucose-6-phosphatase